MAKAKRAAKPRRRAPAKADTDQRKVATVIRSLLPNGSRPGGDGGIDLVPAWPPDAYAVAATLLERSGGYHFIRPMRFDPIELPAPTKQDDPFEVFGPHQLELRIRGIAWAHGLPFIKKQANYADYLDRALAHFRHRYDFYSEKALKRADERIPMINAADIQRAWTALVNTNDEVLLPNYDSLERATVTFPDWWKHALHLLIMADEASAGLGFPARGAIKPTFWQEYLVSEARQAYFESGSAAPPPAAGEVETPSARVGALHTLTKGKNFTIGTLCVMVRPETACVLPKARTPTVGCTLRSLSHHLALVPPAGRATVRWHLLPPGDRDSQTVFNLLLIPFPYEIDSRCFRPAEQSGRSDLFETDQLWLSGNLSQLAFIQQLVEQSEAEIHGVVLPEYALNWTSFEVVREALVRYPSIELFVCGLSQDNAQTAADEEPRLTNGNFVATCMRVPGSRGESEASRKWNLVAIRGKHHRWRLDRRQLSRYGLAHRLSPDRGWWENIDLEPRKIDVIPFRHGSALTALICEDLARIEPCQAVLRATGPNLVIVLLMDGPQIEQRWPNQYAGVLADDPGCSVVTLTSTGLSNRVRAPSNRDPHSIGLWRDGFGNTQRLELGAGEHALVITMMAESLEESTLDGRSDGGSAFGWRLSGVNPISLKGVD